MNEKKNPEKPDEQPFWVKRRGVLIALGLLVVLVLMSLLNSPFVTGEKIVPYSEFKSIVRADKIQSVAIYNTHVIAKPTEEAEAELSEHEEGEIAYKVWRSNLVAQDDTLIPLLDERGIEYEAFTSGGCEGQLTTWLFPLLLLVFFWSFMFRRMGAGGANPAAEFGKSRAKLNLETDTHVTFGDVAGCDEAKEELGEIVHFLKEPEKFTRLGGKVPKGVLLVGPPGTGKTLLARAVAGEADVAFFNLSGSDFVEMFVGVGAARVRDLFEQAQKQAPCIIFVDELDAIGKSRGQAIQSNEEREQTLNALLVEMDGFSSNAGVILLAATNRPEVLDPALLRPGRFDRQVVVDRPDVKGRLAILQVHARAIVKSDDLDLEALASQTPGFVGADLANVVNEAALLAARKGKDAVYQADFQEAIERVIGGLERKSRRLIPKEKKIVAYHESGHAIVSGALEGADEVRKVSIVSRGAAALGYTLQVPPEDRYLMTKSELKAKICGLLGGRAAEAIVFGDVSTGAGNDLQRVTDIARHMIADYGMSDVLGNVSYGDGESYIGAMGVSSRQFSEQTAVSIDQEIHTLVSSMYDRTVEILNRNHALLVEMSEYLIENEVLDGETLQAFMARVEPFSVPAEGFQSVDRF